MTAPLLMSSAQAATHLGVSLSWLEKAVGRGQVQHTRVGRLVKFSDADLRAFISARVRPATQPPRRGGSHPGS